MTDETSREQRFHAVANTLQVVKGALSALGTYGHDLVSADKRQLREGIAAAMVELEGLIGGGGELAARDPGVRSLDLAIEAARGQGVDVRIEDGDVPALHGDGDELTSLLTEFLIAACSTSGGRVRAVRSDDHVRIDVVTGPVDGSSVRLGLRLLAG